jgi:two-component system, cell cycle response regulator DivK
MKKVLVVEDNDSNYILMSYFLKNDYEVLRASNGVEAVDRVKEGGVDVVLMDIKMPIMDGIEATKTIRTFNTEIPIVALTANAFDTDRELALSAGCNDFITKPVSRQTTLDTVKKFI